MFDQDLPKSLLKTIFINSHPILLDEVPHQTIKISIEHKTLYNASIVHQDNGFLVSARSSNSNTVREISPPAGFSFNDLTNENHLFYFNKKDDLVNHQLIDDQSVRDIGGSDYHGIEDIRLFYLRDEIHGIATHVTIKDKLEAAEYIARPVTFLLKDNRIVDPKLWESPIGKKIEKNWTPLVKDEILYLAYNLNPLCLFKVDSHNGSLIAGELTNDLIKFCGGTPFIEIGNFFISVAHHPKFSIDKHYYRHCFIVLDHAFEVVEISEPFFIQRRGIEFACGLIREKDDLILSYGVADRSAFYSRFSINSLRKFLVSI